jgi:HTH-type transcriptional regulator, glycine betaine synthesis regulator
MATPTTPRQTLADAKLLAADAIGDVIEHWGFRKALGRVWTILYLETEPLAAPDISARLSMSAGAVSMTLTELQRWGVVRRVWRPGERKDFFEAETDFWKMISKVVNERERFLAVSVKDRLAQAARLVEDAPSTTETRASLERLRRLLSFASIAEAVLDSFISSRLADFSEFSNLLVLTGARSSRRK